MKKPKVGEPCIVEWDDAHSSDRRAFDWDTERCHLPQDIIGSIVKRTPGIYLGIHDGSFVLARDHNINWKEREATEYHGNVAIPVSCTRHIYCWGDPLP